MKKKKFCIPLLIMGILLASTTGCSNDDETVESQTYKVNNLVNFSHSGCKTAQSARSQIPGTRSETGNQEIIRLEGMSGGRLFIEHFNAIYCCEQEELTVDATLQGHDIMIVEKEVGANADCVCPLDLNTLIDKLEDGEYTLSMYRYNHETPFAKFEIVYSPTLKVEKPIN